MSIFRNKFKNIQDAAEFKHSLISGLPHLEQVTLPVGRYYRHPNGNRYISVTTALGTVTDKKDYLDRWRKSVGEEEAAGIARNAALKGTDLHEMLENYVSNQPNYSRGYSPVAKQLFNDLKPYLDSNIDEVYGIELKLFSDTLKLAGTADLVCKWQGRPAIVDYKNARNPRTEDQIKDYYLQSTAYSIMFEELTGIKTDRFVILMAVRNNPPQIWMGKRSDHINKVLEMKENINEVFARIDDYESSASNTC